MHCIAHLMNKAICVSISMKHMVNLLFEPERVMIQGDRGLLLKVIFISRVQI
jgi:hypothetical protein